MKRRTRVAIAIPNDAIPEQANPFAGSSLVPMLISGIVLVLVGMVVAVMLS